MPILKNLTGNVTITVDGDATSFIDYGVPPQSGDVTYQATNNRTAVFTDPATPDSVIITTPPNRGRITARSDGRFTFDMQGEDPLDDSDVTFVYDRVIDSVPTSVNATVQIENNYRNEGGWLKPKYYLPEIDHATDRFVVEPAPNYGGKTHRAVYIDQSSTLDQAAIAAREGVSEGTITNNWLRLNPAVPGPDLPEADGVLYYGEVESMAMPPFAQADNMVRDLFDRDEWNCHVYYKRGEDYVDGFSPLDRNYDGFAFSALHPQFAGAYGTGAAPINRVNSWNPGTYTDGLVCQDLHNIGVGVPLAGQNIVLDHVRVEGKKVSASGVGDHVMRGLTVRGLISVDVNTPPGTLSEWPVNENGAVITEGMYAANITGLAFFDSFVTGAGWGYDTGYSMDRNGANGQSPQEFMHSLYWGLKNSHTHVRNSILNHGCFSSMQFRCGGIVHRTFSLGHNGPYNPGNGPNDIEDGERGAGRGSQAVQWSMLDDLVITQGGFKDRDGGTGGNYNMGLAGGIAVACDKLSLPTALVINDGGLPANVLDETAIIRRGISQNRANVGTGKWFAVKVISNTQVNGNNISRDGLIASNWNRAAEGDKNVGSVPEATRDALTIGDWTDIATGGSGNDDYTFDDYLRTLPSPWTQIPSLLNYFLGPFGKAPPTRTAAQTVTFAPDPIGDTPACLALYERDWDTRDLPGTVSGDNIDLDGHLVRWNYTPDNQIANFIFGEGGELAMYGSRLAPQDWVVDAGGNTIEMQNGSKIDIDAYTSSNVLTIYADESRIRINGDTTGAIEATVRDRGELVIMEGASMTVPSGRVLTLGGTALAGFDGTGGGAASLTISSGAFLKFEVGVIFEINNCPKYSSTGTSGIGSRNMPTAIGTPEIGDGVTAVTSGTTAIAGRRIDSNGSAFICRYDNIQGSGFVDNEFVSGPTWAGEYYIGDSRTDPVGADLEYYGEVNGTPTYEIASVKEFRSGINGLTDPNLTTNITLEAGSTIEVGDVSLLAPGTYDLIDVDSLTDSGASLPSGVAVSGNKLVLTVA